ncbi:MAG TPA: FG-GAP-like repeat-containing protein [Bacteroidia bacterium]|nr:FG-GAP-like repeat-containing protein [Bacteroidia bacterium]
METIKVLNSPKIKYLILLLVFQSLCFNSIAQTFTKIITGPLVSTNGDSRSVNWIDVNNDGFIDCFISNGPQGGQNNMLYINNGAGGFTAVANDTIVKDNQPSDGATWADCDNDGDLDCYVVNWYNTSNLFYTNDGSGTFTKVPGIINTSGGYCETASWGDYDDDGLVDLYVTNSAGVNKNLLYHNDGNNSFTKITTGDAVNDIADSRCVNWTDMDADGDPDLFVTNESNQNENIYRNDGGGAFTKLTSGALANDGGKTMSAAWADYDNDGDMDVFLANDQGNDGLFRNDGNFNFIKITADTVSNCGGNSFSSAWSDIDNDGDLDLFVTNSFWAATLLENFLFLNNGNGTFTRVSNTAPATDLDWSYGCAFGDYDNDGFEDLAVATCRFNSIDRPDLLYHNDGNSNHWITIKLVGNPTNKAAIGTKIKIKAIINGLPVWQMREISAQTSYCGQNDLRAHFGLGNGTVVDSVKVEWLSGTIEFYANVSFDQFITITEGQGITGMNENKQNDGIHIFPNPATGIVTIKISNHQLQPGDKITITNVLGETEKEFAVQSASEKFEINLKELKAKGNGLLYFSVYSKSGLLTRKVLKM